MILARVVGNIVATQKNHRYENARVQTVLTDLGLAKQAG